MPADPAARRVVTADDIARLAELLDRFENVDDPLAAETLEAGYAFEALVEQLFARCVQPYFSSVTLPQFRGHLRARCKALIAQQVRKPPAPPP